MKTNIENSISSIRIPQLSSLNPSLKKRVWILKCPWCKRYFEGDVCPHCGYKKNK